MRLKWDLNPVVELPPLKVTTCMWVEMTKGCHGAPAPDQSWCSITSLGLGQVVLISGMEGFQRWSQYTTEPTEMANFYHGLEKSSSTPQWPCARLRVARDPEKAQR